MRILFTFMGGVGHFTPLRPAARAAADAGHLVAFGCAPSLAADVKAAGFEVFPMGDAKPDMPQRLPLRPLDAAREEQDFRDGFAQQAAQQRAPRTLKLCEQWKPDLLVIEECDFGSMVAAERLGLPYATLLTLVAGSFIRAGLIEDVLNNLRAEHNLPPDPKLEMLRRHLVLSPVPPSFRDAAFPLPETGRSIRPYRLPRAGGPRPDWVQRLPDAPTVYLTLGTIFNLESGDLFNRALAGLRDLPVNVIVTVGEHITPAEFGPQPPHIRIERFIPQDQILPYVDLVVSHGGSGSVTGTLEHGLPSVLIPMGADQPLNAARCVALGMGKALDPIAATAEDIRTATADVLADSAYRRAAERLRDEFDRLPGPELAVEWLEQVAVGMAPAG